MRWHFSGDEMRMVRQMCDAKIIDRVPSTVERQTRFRRHSLGTTPKQIATVWAHAAKRRQ